MSPSLWFIWLLVVVQCCLWAQSEKVKIIRGVKGDRFSTTCCNCCDDYKAFCSPPNFCQCNNGLSYYKNNTKSYSCFAQSEILDSCSYGISTNSQNYDDFFFAFHSTDIELGTLFMRKSINSNMKRCHINSIHYDDIQKWTLGVVSDFKLIKAKNELKLKFVGDPTEYYGKLLNLTMTCGSKTSCLMFKVGGEMLTDTGDAMFVNEVEKSTPLPNVEEEKKGMAKWMLWVGIGVVLVILVVICVVVFVVKRRKRQRRNHKSSKKSIKKSKEVLTPQTDDNRNSIHDQVAMYVTHDDHVELSSAYVDPDEVFNNDSSEKVKNPNYDYAYSHSALPPPPAEKHEYMDIEPDHPYTKPTPLPCPDSRKSLGYAILKGVDDVKEPSSPPVPSEYQALTLEENDNPLMQDEEYPKSPGSPKYFQLDDDHAI